MSKQLDFDSMKWYERLHWYIKLYRMDNPFIGCEKHWWILPPSYYYTHTEEECEAEKQRIVAEIRKAIDELDD